jgi:hypothetical protein
MTIYHVIQRLQSNLNSKGATMDDFQKRVTNEHTNDLAAFKKAESTAEKPE